MFMKMMPMAPNRPTSMPAIAPVSVVPFHQMPVSSIGTNAEAPTENAQVTIMAMSAGYALSRPKYGIAQPEDQRQQREGDDRDLADADALGLSGVRVDVLLVDVVADGRGGGDQQTADGGEHGRERACGHDTHEPLPAEELSRASA